MFGFREEFVDSHLALSSKFKKLKDCPVAQPHPVFEEWTSSLSSCSYIIKLYLLTVSEINLL